MCKATFAFPSLNIHDEGLAKSKAFQLEKLACFAENPVPMFLWIKLLHDG